MIGYLKVRFHEVSNAQKLKYIFALLKFRGIIGHDYVLSSRKNVCVWGLMIHLSLETGLVSYVPCPDA